MPRATSAAWEALPPSLVRMPRAAWKPETSSASVNGRTRITARPSSAGGDGVGRSEDDRALRGTWRCADPAGEDVDRVGRVERRVQERVEPGGVNRGDRRRAVEQTLVHGVHGEPHGGLGRAFGVARLEHVQMPLLDRELGVLDVAVMALQQGEDLDQLGVGAGITFARSAMSRVLRTPDTTSSPWALVRKSPDGRGSPVSSSRLNATPEPDVSPLLPKTICWTLTAVPQSSGMPLIRR